MGNAGLVDNQTSPGPSSAPATGNERLDAALLDVAELGDVDVAGHVARFEAVHDVLRDILNPPPQSAS